jgi:hypothetical protein
VVDTAAATDRARWSAGSVFGEYRGDDFGVLGCRPVAHQLLRGARSASGVAVACAGPRRAASLDSGRAGSAVGARDNSPNVAWAIDTSITTGNSHAVPGGHPRITASARSASKDRKKAHAATAIVINSPNTQVSANRRIRRLRATECVDPNTNAGGTTDAIAASS